MDHWSLRRALPALLVVTRRTDASSARSRRVRIFDQRTGFQRHLYPREWTHPPAASTFPLNVSADFSSVCHLQAGPPQLPAPSFWSSIDVPVLTSKILASRSVSALISTSSIDRRGVHHEWSYKHIRIELRDTSAITAESHVDNQGISGVSSERVSRNSSPEPP